MLRRHTSRTELRSELLGRFDAPREDECASAGAVLPVVRERIANDRRLLHRAGQFVLVVVASHTMHMLKRERRGRGVERIRREVALLN